MIREEFTFNLYKTLFYGRYFKPKQVKGVIVLVHGMGEHSKRYENFVIPYFYQNSIGVLTFDLFGHGLTEGKRGHNPGFEAVLDSVEYVLERALEIFGEVPLILYGHSLGGNIVINYALRRAHRLDGIIATSPFLRLAFNPPIWKIKIGEILQKIMPSVTMGNEIDASSISRDEMEVELYKNDPLNHDRVSPNYSIVFMKTGEWAIKNSSELKVPMLLLHGKADQLTSWKASDEFYKGGKDNIEFHLYENAYHELHHDLNKKEVLEKMVSWTNKIIMSNNNL